MTAFKPTHRLQSGAPVELEHRFDDRTNGVEWGLFYLERGVHFCCAMVAVTELPKVIQVAAHEEPEPLRVAPAVGTEYWVISDLYEEGVCDVRWEDDKTDRRILAQGKAYATRQDAIAADAARQKARGFA